MGAISDFIKPTEFTTGPLTLDEMMKIISLLENPAQAADVRKALRFYMPPDGLEYTWGKSGEMMKMLRGYSCQQNENELASMLELVAGARSILEIGSGFGGTLKRMASVMQKGSTVVAVELPLEESPRFLNAIPSLKETCRQIGILGAKVQLFIGDSHAATLRQTAESYAPYDFVFLDGDSSYEGQKADWEEYGPMSKAVGIHGIIGNKLWDEIKAQGLHVEEFIHDKGIGIVYRE